MAIGYQQEHVDHCIMGVSWWKGLVLFCKLWETSSKEKCKKIARKSRKQGKPN